MLKADTSKTPTLNVVTSTAECQEGRRKKRGKGEGTEREGGRGSREREKERN